MECMATPVTSCRIGTRAGRQDRKMDKISKTETGAPDPLLVELVQVLARAAAERDYAKMRKSEKAGKRRPEDLPEI
ncbi:MAG TPA: hypothetical protein VNE82_23655 [Candidatus Binataceae bacterium]|nr:hypothetical protein [Candidatus Binataceae bacterium]